MLVCHPLMQVYVNAAPLIFVGRFCYLDTLGLTFSPLLVILAGNGGYQLNQHRVNRSQHSTGELVAFGVSHPLVTGW